VEQKGTAWSRIWNWEILSNTVSGSFLVGKVLGAEIITESLTKKQIVFGTLLTKRKRLLGIFGMECTRSIQGLIENSTKNFSIIRKFDVTRHLKKESTKNYSVFLVFTAILIIISPLLRMGKVWYLFLMLIRD
jgi:hypothetical protein